MITLITNIHCYYLDVFHYSPWFKSNVTVFQKTPEPLAIGAIQRTREILPLYITTSGNRGV